MVQGKMERAEWREQQGGEDMEAFD